MNSSYFILLYVLIEKNCLLIFLICSRHNTKGYVAETIIIGSLIEICLQNFLIQLTLSGSELPNCAISIYIIETSIDKSMLEDVKAQCLLHVHANYSLRSSLLTWTPLGSF